MANQILGIIVVTILVEVSDLPLFDLKITIQAVANATAASASLKQAASREHADYIKLSRINTTSSHDLLSGLDPDVFLSLACPQILGKNSLSIPRLGSWNVHSSLLPKNRGMLPTFWSLFHGDKPGVTLHRMVEKLDAGGILLQRPVDAYIENTSVQQLQVKSKQYKILEQER